MEDETREFFVLIANTISLVLLWMLVNVFVGLYKGLAFFEDLPNWKNYLYYTWFLLSLFFLVRHVKKKWRN